MPRSWFACLALLVIADLVVADSLDRQAIVRRHSPVLHKIDPVAPVTVGNGGFAFSADVTGLQTLSAHYHRLGVPIETLCRWAWYTEPNPHNYELADTSEDYREANGRVVGYPTNASTDAGKWLRRNPRNHPLGQLGFVHSDGSPITPGEISQVEQHLDLWSGVVSSRFTLAGFPVEVVTICHPDRDLVAVKMKSPLLSLGKLRIRLAFPLGHDASVKNTPRLDWSRPEEHVSRLIDQTENRLDIERQRDSLIYHAALAWTGDITIAKDGEHHFLLRPEQNECELSLCFSPHRRPDRLPTFIETRHAARKHWRSFWSESAAVDFSGSTDLRAEKLERRIVLSRYLTAVQLAGKVPPQESGLTCSTWYGKHHTEMIWWHTAHFALWGHDEFLVKNLDWYVKQISVAKKLATSRGLSGARWAKMVGPSGRESPGGNPLIIWNQPHPIYLAELLYRNHPTMETANHYAELVFATADCLAAMTHFDKEAQTYVLGPPLWIAQEIYDRATSQNPGFELAYWRWSLLTAQRWRERLGMTRNQQWDHIIEHLSPLPEKDGKYVALASHPDTWENLDSRHDHPTMLAPLGLLPESQFVERETMGRTLDAVLSEWDWKTKIWGWDYPLIAMTATRLHRPDDAVAILLRAGPNNRYFATGHCPQRELTDPRRLAMPGRRRFEIATYLPANGSFLSAAALMIAGWDGCERQLPGFPQDGTWNIRFAGLRRLP